MKKTPSHIQHAGLKLCYALMLGLLVVPAYVVAPLLFAELASLQAGLIAGKIFHVSNLTILILALAAASFAYRVRVSRGSWYILVAVVAMVMINAFGVSAMIAMIKEEAGDISMLAKDDAMLWMFKFWHGLGSILQLVSTVLMAALVMKSQLPHSKPIGEVES